MQATTLLVQMPALKLRFRRHAASGTQPPITVLRTGVPFGKGQQISDRDLLLAFPTLSCCSWVALVSRYLHVLLPRPPEGDFSRGRALHEHIEVRSNRGYGTLASKIKGLCPCYQIALPFVSGLRWQQRRGASIPTHPLFDSSPPRHPPTPWLLQVVPATAQTACTST